MDLISLILYSHVICILAYHFTSKNLTVNYIIILFVQIETQETVVGFMNYVDFWMVLRNRWIWMFLS